MKQICITGKEEKTCVLDASSSIARQNKKEHYKTSRSKIQVQTDKSKASKTKYSYYSTS